MAEPPEHISSRGPAVLVVTAIMLVLSTIFVVLRMISRVAIVRKVTLDDYFMILSWFIAFGLSFAICYGTSVGLGRHQKDIPYDWNLPLKKSEYVFSVLYNPALMATKTSILLFYLNLSKTERIFRWATIGTLAMVNLAGLALTFLNAFQCSPVGAAFKTPVPLTDHCEYIVTLYLSSAPVNIITDLAILLLPMPMLTSMRLPRKQKIILIITFGFGFFVAVVDVIRIAYLQEAATARLQGVQTNNPNDTGADQRNTTDVPWYASLSYMWSAVEVNVGIMCACVPGLKPLVSRFMPTALRDYHERGLSATRETEKVDSLDMAVAHRIPSLNTHAPIQASPRKPGEIHTFGSSRAESEEPMDMIDFLTTPDMTEYHSNTCQRTQTAMTNTSRNTAPPTFFDFVNVKRSKSMVHMTTRESMFPNIMVTILFLVWGVAYGFLDALNFQFQRTAHMSPAQTVGIHSSYFGAYLVGTLTFGRLVLKHWGFKACYIVGLCIYACGVLVFWPSAVLTSFPAFLISNFIVGLGLSTLEIAANPFVALCGPPQYMEIRLNLSQGVQAIGSVVSPLLASKVLFRKTSSAGALIDVQWTYLGIALFTVLLAVAYYYVPLPEATDKELEEAAEREDFAHLSEFNGIRVIWITLALGVFAQFCYVGAQEAIATSFNAYVRGNFLSKLDPPSWQAIGHTCFALGRFIAAGLNYFIKPRYLLFFFVAGAATLSAIGTHGKGTTPQIVIMLLFFFEGPIFSLIYASCLRGLGKHTKLGSAFLTAAISGGAAWPPIMYAVATGPTPRRRYQHAYSVVVAALACGIVLPIWQNLFPAARKIADPPKAEPRDDNELPSLSSIRNRSGFLRRRKNEAEHVERAWPS
ncbi:MFS monosaccharide transporter-like protein [Tothia fuscella]|uniref:MFS monosaccharide transporter-like protein n=1 Tax=Tothia fuscella TaxID=1048955 RepID=A0A9P4NVL1_9PEZI|nr:MFS monosaccharide transporter-like protein [Tothia fuscella]